ncbi:MAG TPA: TatD family hydrolase [Firmicutes bacterium]|nr:TatD family hydrolase [Bacillota bacterium]
MFVDSHAHVNNDRLLKDEAEVIAQAEAAGVQVIVNVGWDLPSSKRAVEQAEKYPGVYAAVGIHPHDAKTYTEEALAELARLAKHPKVVALGEMGLDYYYDNSPRDQQRFVFKQQLELARKLGLPVIIHNRDAHGDTWEILQRQEVVGGVMHCYSGSVELAKKLLDRGFYLGFAGPITFKNAVKPVEVVNQAPMERILVETDCPYLTPEPHRGKRNEPAFVTYVAQKVAEIKGLEVDEVARITTANAKSLFKIG